MCLALANRTVVDLMQAEPQGVKRTASLTLHLETVPLQVSVAGRIQETDVQRRAKVVQPRPL